MFIKRFFCIFLFVCIIFGCCACNVETENREANGYTFTDDIGREVTVRSHERTACLLGSYADVWFLAGGTVWASSDDAFTDFDIDLPDGAVNLGGTKDLSLELLLSMEPDFVIASSNTPQHLEWEETLNAAGVTVAYFDVSGFEDYLHMLRICCDITGNNENYLKYGENLKSGIDEINSRGKDREEQKVLVLRASAASIRAKNSKVTVVGEMLENLNCRNIADSDKSLLENLNIESILLDNPDKIFIIEVGDDIEGIKKNVESMFSENPLWHELTAVKNGDVYYLDKHLYGMKPNARWLEAYSNMENILNGKK